MRPTRTTTRIPTPTNSQFSRRTKLVDTPVAARTTSPRRWYAALAGAVVAVGPTALPTVVKL
jgi:hypothetical protein